MARWGAGTITALAVLLALVRPATAADVLANGGFESWPLSPGDWIVTSGSAEEASSPSVSGSSAHVSGASPVLQQRVSAKAGATYTGRIAVRAANGGINATLSLVFLDAAGATIDAKTTPPTETSAGEFAWVQVTGTAPAGTAYARFDVRPGGAAYLDAASLDEDIPPPTATPTASPTPTATPAPVPTATGAPPPTATSPPEPSPTHAASEQSTATPTRAPSTATPTPTSTPRDTGPLPPWQAPTATPTPAGAAPTSTPTTRPSSATPTNTPAPSVGGLLANAGFERVSGGTPVSWSKYGGTMGVTSSARQGSRAVTLESSTTSTKWVHQVVPISGGQWYALRGWARVASGSCELFFRLSWYTSKDGSGRTMHQDDSGSSTSGSWRQLATGAVQAPSSANSVRVRMLLRPNGPCTAAFDAMVFARSSPATPTPQPTATPRPTQTTGGGSANPTSTPAQGDGGGSSNATSTPAGGGGDDGGDGDGGDSDGGTEDGSSSSGSGSSSGGSSGSGSVSFAGEAAADGGSLVISEVLSDADTPSNDNENEWVEVYNVSDEPVDLAGWHISDAVDSDVLPALVIGPGEYAVIAGGLAELPEGTSFVRVPDGRIGRGLNNGGDAIVLVEPGGAIIDAMSYGDDETYDGGPAAPGPGETIARRIDGDGSWATSETPTPGEANAFPPEPTATLGPETAEEDNTPAPSATNETPQQATDGEDPEESAVLDEGPPVELVDDGDSIVPWIILAAVAGAGVTVAAGSAPRGLRWVRERKRNGD